VIADETQTEVYATFLFSPYEFLVKRALFFHGVHPRSAAIIASLSEKFVKEVLER